ncbi:unnamed protein product [Amoebophrya sp. A120]|nr:unnamed protein product [Amoebophrya sp. A120]|eukprot:GSA120T00023467001.1
MGGPEVGADEEIHETVLAYFFVVWHNLDVLCQALTDLSQLLHDWRENILPLVIARDEQKQNFKQVHFCMSLLGSFAENHEEEEEETMTTLHSHFGSATGERRGVHGDEAEVEDFDSCKAPPPASMRPPQDEQAVAFNSDAKHQVASTTTKTVAGNSADATAHGQSKKGTSNQDDTTSTLVLFDRNTNTVNSHGSSCTSSLQQRLDRNQDSVNSALSARALLRNLKAKSTIHGLGKLAQMKRRRPRGGHYHHHKSNTHTIGGLTTLETARAFEATGEAEGGGGSGLGVNFRMNVESVGGASSTTTRGSSSSSTHNLNLFSAGQMNNLKSISRKGLSDGLFGEVVDGGVDADLATMNQERTSNGTKHKQHEVFTTEKVNKNGAAGPREEEPDESSLKPLHTAPVTFPKVVLKKAISSPTFSPTCAGRENIKTSNHVTFNIPASLKTQGERVHRGEVDSLCSTTSDEGGSGSCDPLCSLENKNAGDRNKPTPASRTIEQSYRLLTGRKDNSSTTSFYNRKSNRDTPETRELRSRLNEINRRAGEHEELPNAFGKRGGGGGQQFGRREENYNRPDRRTKKVEYSWEFTHFLGSMSYLHDEWVRFTLHLLHLLLPRDWDTVYQVKLRLEKCRILSGPGELS